MRTLTLSRLSVVLVAALAALACRDLATAPTADFARGGNPGPPGGTDTKLPGEIAHCDTEIRDLHAAIDAALYRNPDKDEVGLLGKNVEAADKLNQDKFGDAGGKLDDLGSKFGSLVDSGKISDDPAMDGDQISAIAMALDAAQACVSGLME